MIAAPKLAPAVVDVGKAIPILMTIAQRKALEVFNSLATFVLFYGGSRSGKTFFAVFLIVLRALLSPNSRHLIARHRFNHAKTSIWYDTLPKVLSKCFPGVAYEENKTDWFIRFENGAEIWIAGLDDKKRTEKILGNEYATIYLNESSQISYEAFSVVVTRLAQRVLTVTGRPLRLKMLVDCNPPEKSHWIYQIFFLFRDPVSREPKNPADYAQIRLNPKDNTDNIGAEYLKILETLPARQRRRFLDGDFLDQVEGAQFKAVEIDEARLDRADDLIKTAVAVDPATTTGEASDETGIIVGGIDDQKPTHGYVLADLSGKYQPSEWARIAIRAYYAYEADFIIAEVNQGGQMVRQTIHSIDPNVKIRMVRATKGKLVRAEPISAFYEQRRIHHVGPVFHELEEQLTTYTGARDQKSPDRLDALVWLFFGLLIQSTATPSVLPSASGD